MVVTDTDRAVVQRMAEAMNAGDGLALIDLFTADAVFIEPFSGIPRTFVGIEAIRSQIQDMVAQPRPPGFTLKVDQVTSENGELVSYWTCSAPVMPGPMKGRDELKIRDGRISFLKIEILSMPGTTT